jgi:hypothetical protein
MVGQSQVLVLIVILIIGIAFGAGVAWWMAGSRKSNSAKSDPAPAPDEFAGLRARFTEQVGVWHEKQSGKLVLRLDNQMLEQSGQLNSSQRARLEALIKEWLAWMGVAQAAPAPVQPPVILVPPPAAAPTPSQPRVTTAPAAAVPAKPKSIVEQIDEILQEKLANSSSSNKGVRLVEDRVHGVVVWIGLDHYDGVDRVTDPEVRALLSESAQEWERRATPAK